MWTFLIALLVLCAVARLIDDARLLGTAMVLLANWTLNTTIANSLADAYPWPWFLATDYLSGFVLVALAGRPSLWQIVVTVLYAIECIAHGAFGLTSRTPWTEYYYWHVLSYTAWLQLWIVAGWCGAELARRRGWIARGASSPVSGVVRDSAAHPEP